MATTPFSPYVSSLSGSSNNPFMGAYAERDASRTPVAIRRRPNQVQGQALEILGHAIEYLVDSRVVSVSGNRMDYNREAVDLLSKSSREIFSGCAVVVPLSDRLKAWLYGPSRNTA